jgi:hypothetical protein
MYHFNYIKLPGSAYMGAFNIAAAWLATPTADPSAVFSAASRTTCECKVIKSSAQCRTHWPRSFPKSIFKKKLVAPNARATHQLLHHESRAKGEQNAEVVTENGLERDAGHVFFLISAGVIERTT